MSDVPVIPLVDVGLGNSTYLVDLGGLTLKALTTPGHTAEHLSYLLLDVGAAVLDGGPADWVQAAGRGLEAGR